MPRKKKLPAAEARKSTNARQETSIKAEAGKLWIDPNLSRKVASPGGNRGAHTTPAAELLKLADIVLKTGR